MKISVLGKCSMDQIKLFAIKILIINRINDEGP
jgi:hypothetical protein